MKKTIKIGKYVSTGAAPVVVKKCEIKSIKMSCGGGMGGSSWYEYGLLEKPVTLDSFVELTDIFTGEKKILNPNFIVKVVDRKLVSVKSDCRFNPAFSFNYIIQHYLMGCDTEYTLVNACNVEVEGAELIGSERFD